MQMPDLQNGNEITVDPPENWHYVRAEVIDGKILS